MSPNQQEERSKITCISYASYQTANSDIQVSRRHAEVESRLSPFIGYPWLQTSVCNHHQSDPVTMIPVWPCRPGAIPCAL